MLEKEGESHTYKPLHNPRMLMVLITDTYTCAPALHHCLNYVGRWEREGRAEDIGSWFQGNFQASTARKTLIPIIERIHFLAEKNSGSEPRLPEFQHSFCLSSLLNTFQLFLSCFLLHHLYSESNSSAYSEYGFEN